MPLFNSFLREKMPDLDQQSVAQTLGIGAGTFSNLKSSGECSGKIARQIAAATGIPIKDLVYRDNEHRIPFDAEWISRLRYGYFVDHDRSAAGSLTWFSDRFTFRQLKSRSSNQLLFTVNIVSNHGQKFSARASFGRGRQLIMIADERNGIDGFSSNHTHKEGDSVLGVWSGFDDVGVAAIAVFPGVISHTKKRPSELLALINRIGRNWIKTPPPIITRMKIE